MDQAIDRSEDREYQKLHPASPRKFNHIVEVLKTEQGMLDSVVRREVQESVGQINHTLSIASDDWRRYITLTNPSRLWYGRFPLASLAPSFLWNAPVSLATAKVIPALLAGNAVIVKPSPELLPESLSSRVY